MIEICQQVDFDVKVHKMQEWESSAWKKRERTVQKIAARILQLLLWTTYKATVVKLMIWKLWGFLKSGKKSSHLEGMANWIEINSVSIEVPNFVF